MASGIDRTRPGDQHEPPLTALLNQGCTMEDNDLSLYTWSGEAIKDYLIKLIMMGRYGDAYNVQHQLRNPWFDAY